MTAVARQLFERRVPQYVALYLGLAWGIVQFVNFLEERYALSPHFTDMALLGSILLLPSVVLFTFNHGRPGVDAWVRSEKIGIPLNLVLAHSTCTPVWATWGCTSRSRSRPRRSEPRRWPSSASSSPASRT